MFKLLRPAVQAGRFWRAGPHATAAVASTARTTQGTRPASWRSVRWASSDHIVFHPDDGTANVHDEELLKVPAADEGLQREVAAFTARVQLAFNDEDLLLQAVTHRTWTIARPNAEHGKDEWVGPPVCNGRLQTIGSAAIKSAISQYLFLRYPLLKWSMLQSAAEYCVDREVLTRAALNVGFQHTLRCRQTALKNIGHPESDRVISDCFSALIGAILVDSGVAEANQFALDMLVPLLDEVGIENFVVIANPQKALHAHLRAKELAPPDYRMLAESGRKTHAPVYLVGVYSGDLKLAEGASYNIKLAQNEAALAALRQSHGASESDTVLPASWGEYAAEDVKAYIRDVHAPSPDVASE